MPAFVVFLAFEPASRRVHDREPHTGLVINAALLLRVALTYFDPGIVLVLFFLDVGELMDILAIVFHPLRFCAS